jgi:RNA polymerase-binding transcription factor DksA
LGHPLLIQAKKRFRLNKISIRQEPNALQCRKGSQRKFGGTKRFHQVATNANARPRNGKYNAAERVMMEQRDELIARITMRMSEVHIDREPDDQAALASDNAMKDLAVVTLERERRTLAEIEAALRRIKEGKYCMCRPCGKRNLHNKKPSLVINAESGD